ncbi:MAG: CarD family transcriptional regulator, partial [Acidimicrobiia bacterium]|nr:CarD family transcriptional regulator [Acidimicrobiia bacterium]
MKKFKKGDTVIYPQHGACTVKVIKRMKAFDTVQEYLILE